MAATAAIKQELAASSTSSSRSHAINPPYRSHHAPSLTNTYVDPATHWQPPSLNQSFIRSEAPPPTLLYATAPPAPTIRTADESEPVLMQVRNRIMEATSNGNIPSASQGDSFFDGSFRDIGAKLKACNDTLGELQQLGVNHIVSLPSLVLVGDQSAGKSSLMSGLAGLSLPRSEGVCTRCPTHIRVSRHDDWSCRVSLQLDYSYEPPGDRYITKHDVTPDNPFPPWVRQARVVKEFKTIYGSNKEDIENVLRWAQVAILNHGQNPDAYIPGTGAIPRTQALAEAVETTAAKFSPNTVALEIKGPELPDLSFYDLPGIFRNSAQEEDEYLVQVVENLAREHIDRDDALIIWAVPMNADPETSSTLSIIRDMDAQNRTIGVMTKADLLPSEGTHAQWLDMLDGKRHKIGHEYFITSRPTDQALEDQLRWEEALFHEQGHEKWPGDLLRFRNRCGVERLKAALSEKLGKAFAANLPKIKKKVQLSKAENEKKLASLPELPENIELNVHKALNGFCSLAKDELQGDSFLPKYLKLTEAYRDCLVHTKPKFVMKDPSDKPIIEISDDDNESTVSTPTNRKRGAPPSAAQTPTNKRFRPSINGNGTPSHSAVKAEHGNNGSPQVMQPAPQQLRKTNGLSPPFEQYSAFGSGFRTIRQIQEDIRSKMKPGVPGLVPQKVHETLCKEAVAHWDKPMETFLEATMQLVGDVIKDSLNESLLTMKRRLIFKSAKKHMGVFLREYRDMTLSFMREIYDMEAMQLSTINEDTLKQYRTEEGRTLTRYRHVMRWLAFSGDTEPLAARDWEQLSSEQQASEERKHAAERVRLGPDPFETEVGVAAFVRGYYRLAALRFADTTTLAVTSRMLPRIIARLDLYLQQKLGLMGEGAFTACQSLMDEDDATAEKREKFKAMLEKLKKAEASIQELEMDDCEGGDAAAGERRQRSSTASVVVADSVMDEA